MTLRLAFMGTPEFSVPTLNALVAAGHDIACVYAQPPRRSGRGQSTRPSPVHVAAQTMGLEVRTPPSLKSADEHAAFADLGLDAAVVAAYGQILPAAMIDAPRLGCINLHGSLLPRWRGAAPINRAILAGDQVFGVTIMQMDRGMDTGPILIAETIDVGDRPTAGVLHDAFADRGAALVVEALGGLDDGSLGATPQPADGATHAPKLTKAEGRIDWTRPASELDCHVRGLSPAPGAWFEFDGARIKVLAAEPISALPGTPGEVLDDRLTVACGDGALRLTRLQRAGKGAMDAADFLRGARVPVGTSLRS
ncbi:MAG: methionyl-tRNA formyltransferase [Alphaproteobacteria bacterium]|jgi:methionyl-tRNA formyltransferase|nr:methionyl-tRNA formyltransferase [Alphaproteobacteria bacterium]